MTEKPGFEWDKGKDLANRQKHGVGFVDAQMAFFDSRRVIAEDLEHGAGVRRYFHFGQVGAGVMTVRFTYREGRIRIIGAGYWRKGRTIYERKNGPLHER